MTATLGKTHLDELIGFNEGVFDVIGDDYKNYKEEKAKSQIQKFSEYYSKTWGELWEDLGRKRKASPHELVDRLTREELEPELICFRNTLADIINNNDKKQISEILDHYGHLKSMGMEFSDKEMEVLINNVQEIDFNFIPSHTFKRFTEDYLERDIKNKIDVVETVCNHFLKHDQHNLASVLDIARLIGSEDLLFKYYNKEMKERENKHNINIPNYDGYMVGAIKDISGFSDIKKKEKIFNLLLEKYRNDLDKVHVQWPKEILDFAVETGWYKKIERIEDKDNSESYHYDSETLLKLVDRLKDNKEIERIKSKVKDRIKKDIFKTHNLDDDIIDAVRKYKLFTDDEVVGMVDRDFLENGYKDVGFFGFNSLSSTYSKFMSKAKADGRIKDLCFKIKAYEPLIDHYNKFSKKKNFELGIEFARLGQFNYALKTFTKAFRKVVDTSLKPKDYDVKEFYKTVASAILSLYVKDPSIPCELAKKWINKKFGIEIVKSVDVDKDSGFKLEIDFGKEKVLYEQKSIDKKTRNDVRSFRQKGLGNKNSYLKIYKNKENALAEAHWLKILEGRINSSRLISSERIGNLYINQLETSKGKPLENAGYKTLKKAVDMSFELYRIANSQENGEHVEHFSKEFIKKRINGFDVDAGWLYSTLIKNEDGIIHNDYAPRNFMEGKNLEIIDHECYVFGNPVAMAVTMVKNPDNNITKKQAEKLIAYARKKHPVSEEYVKALNILWDCRQTIGVEKGSESYNWYVKDMKGVMELKGAA